MAKEKRILVVEDDDAIRALLFAVLRRRGFKVDTASNGANGLERCLHCVYSLVLLDLMMPVMGGYEFLERLEKMNPSHRPLVLVLTAGAAPRNLDPKIVAGALRKPFDIELLVETVVACLLTQDDATQRDNCPTAESDGPDSDGARNGSN
jgi:two-component system response regulator CpxR